MFPFVDAARQRFYVLRIDPIAYPRLSDIGRRRRTKPRFGSLDQMIRRCGLRRDEVQRDDSLPRSARLNAAFGFDRRTARSGKSNKPYGPPAKLFLRNLMTLSIPKSQRQVRKSQFPTPNAPTSSPLKPMTVPERLLADYAGTSLTIGPHPMSLRRAELALRGVLRARAILPIGAAPRPARSGSPAR